MRDADFVQPKRSKRVVDYKRNRVVDTTNGKMNVLRRSMPTTVHEKFNHSVLSEQKTTTFESYFKTNFPETIVDVRKSTDVAERHRDILLNKGVKILEKGFAMAKGEKQNYSIDHRTSVG